MRSAIVVLESPIRVAFGLDGPNWGWSPLWHCMSLLSLFGLSGLLHFYIGLRLVPAVPGAWMGGVLALLLVALLIRWHAHWRKNLVACWAKSWWLKTGPAQAATLGQTP